jgi:predicted transcriptional regulator
MEQKGLLSSEKVIVEGKFRKYYELPKTAENIALVQE